MPILSLLAHGCTNITLRNGLKVLLLERHQSPTISFYLRFKAGSVDEESGKTGTAHLLEHMLFKGTKTLGTTDYRAERKLLEQIDRVGERLDAELRRTNARPEQAAALEKRACTAPAGAPETCGQG